MKTSNVFTIEGQLVNVRIFTAPEVRGDKDFKPELLWETNFDASDIPELLQDGEGNKSLRAYGLASLLQDRAASYNDKALLEMNADYTARADRYKEVFDMLCEGTFSDRKKGGGKATAGVDAFFAQGFADFLQSKGKDIDVTTATALLQGMGKEERETLRKHPDIMACVNDARAKAKAAAGELDIASLLA